MNVKHEINRETTTTTWLTPRDILDPLGEFDLDPCTPETMPWETAKKRYTQKEDGLLMPWYGRVWLNPPYGKGMDAWINKMALHGDGIVLIFNRTETELFHNWIFPYADAILFKKGRIHFVDVEGKKVGNGSGCGSILIAFGKHNAEILKNSGIPGKLIWLK